MLLDKSSLAIIAVVDENARHPSLERVRVEEQRCVATDQHMLVIVDHPEPLKEKYPNYEKTFPTTSPVYQTAMRVDTLQKWLAVMADMGVSSVTLTCYGDNKTPLRFDAMLNEDGRHVHGLVMPALVDIDERYPTMPPKKGA